MVAHHSVDFWLSSEDLPHADNRVTRRGRRHRPPGPQGDQPRGPQAAAPEVPVDAVRPRHARGLHERKLYLHEAMDIAATAHQAGTARFGTDPSTSVLDVDCKAHELDNLYVVDSSFFASIGAVNPTLDDHRQRPARRRPPPRTPRLRQAITMTSAERARVEQFGDLENGLRQADDWYLWGPYVSERQWGTVREDYSADGDAWAYLPHDHARSRAYRWGEDGMAGFCDVEQRLCLGLALWNGRDPILKERMFGLTGAEANHGEDVKEYWWYLDAVPSHAWNRWRYHYPQGPFPYDDLLAENGRRGKFDPEYELLDTGVFDERSLLDLRGRLRQGRPDRPADDGPGDERRTRGRHAARAADGVVPQHVVVGRRRREAGAAPGTATTHRTSTTRSSASSSCWPDRRPTGPNPWPCSARTRRTRRACSATPPPTPLSRRTPSTTASSAALGCRQPARARAPRPRCGTRCPWRRARPSSSDSGCDRSARSRRRRPRRSGATSRRSSRSAAARPTSSTPS